jgi:hypothetical protein
MVCSLPDVKQQMMLDDEGGILLQLLCAWGFASFCSSSGFCEGDVMLGECVASGSDRNTAHRSAKHQNYLLVSCSMACACAL